MTSGDPGLIRNPLSGWGNDDLMLTDAAQAHWRTHHPAEFRVLDWPEMRAEFLLHEPRANIARKRAQGQGIVSVLMAGGGVILAALTAVMPEAWRAPAAILAAALVFIGGLWSLWLFALSGQRIAWLSHRYNTERIRQFHFQYILNNLGAAVPAMRDDAALAAYRAARATAFADFLQTSAMGAERIHHLKTDTVEADIWIKHAWAESPKVPDTDKSDLAALLDALRQLRLGIQERYSGAKLAVNAHAPGTRANLFGLAGDLGTGIVVIFAFLSGLALAISSWAAWHPLFWTIVGVFSAVGLMARVMDQGLQTHVDHERYDWYHSAVKAATARFNEGTVRDKISALRDLEGLAYQEMRRFIVAHLRGKFLM
jgi:hypothetical protein